MSPAHVQTVSGIPTIRAAQKKVPIRGSAVISRIKHGGFRLEQASDIFESNQRHVVPLVARTGRPGADARTDRFRIEFNANLRSLDIRRNCGAARITQWP
jgi:hypothetical protein